MSDRIAVFSDIHSNLEALVSVFEDMDKEKISEENRICLGDIVGYGAKPNECINLLRESGIKSVFGNHDYEISHPRSKAVIHEEAYNVLRWTFERLTPENLEYLKNLSFQSCFDIQEAIFTHGTIEDVYTYADNLHGIAQNLETLDAMEKKVLFVGHTHKPIAFVKHPVYPETIFDKIFLELNDKPTLINVGSVGQPRDGNPKSCYVIYDRKNKIISWKRVPYVVGMTQREIVNAGLPYRFAERLEGGI